MSRNEEPALDSLEPPPSEEMSATSSATAGRPKPERLRQALEDFYDRSARRRHPEGGWRDGLWYPSASERRLCCKGILPTIENRQALESHCRAQSHVAALYGVPTGELRAAVRDDRKRGSPIAQRVASSFVVSRPRASETFAQLRGKTRAEAFDKLHVALAQSLPVFERLHAWRDRLPTEDGYEMAALLETAADSAKCLLARIRLAKRQDELMSIATAFLATLQTALEEPRGKRRRAARTSPSGGPPSRRSDDDLQTTPFDRGFGRTQADHSSRKDGTP